MASQAIVLRKMNLGESDKIVTFLTREAGLVKAVAKGATKSRKRFGGVLETGNHINVRIFLKKKTTLHRLEAADLVEPFWPLAQDPVLLAAASHMLELTTIFFGDQAGDSRQFALLVSALRGLSAHGYDEKLLRIFELRTLLYAGEAPNFDYCAQCQTPVKPGRNVVFSPRLGGVICMKCETGDETLRIPPNTRKLFADVLTVESKLLPRLKFTNVDLQVAKKIIPRFCEYQASRKLRSYRMLLRLLKGN